MDPRFGVAFDEQLRFWKGQDSVGHPLSFPRVSLHPRSLNETLDYWYLNTSIIFM